MKSSIKKETIAKEKNETLRAKTSLYLPKQTFQKLDSLLTLTNLRSRNEVITKAVDFYFAYITSELNQEYLCEIFGGKIDSAISSLGTRLARNEFKTAVALDVLTRLQSMELSISKEEYDKLRYVSVESVKKTNGSIDIYTASKEYDK